MLTDVYEYAQLNIKINEIFHTTSFFMKKDARVMSHKHENWSA